MSKQQQIDDKARLELQIIAAVSNLKAEHPNHPFVVAIRAVLEHKPTPEQLELELGQPALLSKQAE